MAYNAITSGQIQVDDPITQGLMQKIADNFEFLYSLTSGGTGLQNGSFDVDSDGDGDPDGWTVADYAGGSHSLDATEANHGASAIKFVHPSGVGNGGGYVESDYFETSELKPFYVDFFNKNSQAGVKNQVVVRFFSEAKVDLSADQTLWTEDSGNPTSWTRYKTGAAVPPATAQFAKIRLIGGYTDTNPGSSTNIWFDGVSLVEEGFSADSAGTVVNPWVEQTTLPEATSGKVIEHLCLAPGTLYSTVNVTDGGSGGVEVQIYVNGVAVGTLHTDNSGGAVDFVDASIEVQVGDLIQIYGQGVNNPTSTVNSWELKTKSGHFGLVPV